MAKVCLSLPRPCAVQALDKTRFMSLTDPSVLGEGDTAKLEMKLIADKVRTAWAVRYERRAPRRAARTRAPRGLSVRARARERTSWHPILGLPYDHDATSPPPPPPLRQCPVVALGGGIVTLTQPTLVCPPRPAGQEDAHAHRPWLRHVEG